MKLLTRTRIFCNYSVIAFHEVFDNMLTDTSVTWSSDLSLLTATTNALRAVCDPERTYSYCTRLHKNFRWCTEIATLIHHSSKSAFANSFGPDSAMFANNAPSSLNSLSFAQGDTTASVPIAEPRPIQDSEGDLNMVNDFRVVESGPSSEALKPVTPNPKLGEMASFQDSLDDDTLYTNDLAPRVDDLTDPLLTQPPQMPPESSVQFQDALKWVFDEGSDLGSSFQQSMSG